jgi:proton-translocating NADH-quinone oxidoreductase chain L
VPNVDQYLWTIPLFPLAGAISCALMGGRRLRRVSHLPCVLGAFLSCAVVLTLLATLPPESANMRSATATWFAIGPVNVELALFLDPLSAIMLVGVTFIGAWIAVFSIGYMHNDEGYARYFSFVSLFLFSMTLLVLADNFVLLFAGWEGVGLCSYLLIGHWYFKPSAAAAARKAFLVTRLGDVGLILGFFLLWSINGNHRFDFEGVVSRRLMGPIDQHHSTVVLACLLILCGAIGKSAQFPLYVWLPDAMEGPTPVSALIHAATMVTAGVYLVARCMPLFVLYPEVQLTVACIGAFTALLAAVIALTQNDLKRVLAYSTVSQIGYMFLALGTAGKSLALFAVAAAMFHLFTHAFFKAVLFLSAGSVMHAMGNVIDMRRFSGLRKVMPVTHLTFLCGAGALAGLPLLSGFWSKDMIFESVLQASRGGEYGAIYEVLFWSALLTAGLTAFYTFRAYFRTFWGETKIPPEAGEHAHESPAVMTVPLIILAVGAVFIGIVIEPFTHWFSGFLDGSDALRRASGGKKPKEHLDWLLMAGSSFVAISGAALAWWMYYRRPGSAAALAHAIPRWYHASLNRFYVDEIFNVLIVQPLNFLALVAKGTEALIFDLVRLIAVIPRGMGQAIRPLQNGLLQFYALTTAMGVAAFIGYLVFFAK